MPNAACSWRTCPRPKPSSSRPPLSTSRVRYSSAARSGWLNGRMVTIVPRRSRVVWAIAAAAITLGAAVSENVGCP